MWFSKDTPLDKKLRGFGCGVVALHDLASYKGYIKPAASQEDFKKRIRKIEKSGIFVFPGLGIAPYYYPFLCNFFLMRKKVPIRMSLLKTARSQDRCNGADIRAAIEDDLPVIFCVGPTIPFLFRDKRLTLYNRDRKPSGQRTKAHYMTVLGVTKYDDEVWLEIASWGAQYCIRLSEMSDFSKYTFPFTTGFYMPREKRNKKL